MAPRYQIYRVTEEAFLINMFAALKGSQFYCLLAVFVIEFKSDTEELLRSPQKSFYAAFMNGNHISIKMNSDVKHQLQ